MPDLDPMQNLEDELRQARADLEARLDAFEQKLDIVGADVKVINGNVARIKAEIGPGIPDPDERGDRPTMRARLHKLENNEEAVTLLASGLTDQLTKTAAVVEELKEERDAMRIEREVNARHWTQLKTRVVFVCAIAGGLSAFFAMIFGALRIFGIGG